MTKLFQSNKLEKGKIIYYPLVFLLAVFCLFFHNVRTVTTGTDHNLFGWAWNDVYGWISFNSLNCDTDGDGFSNGAPGCPAEGDPILNYGVNIETNREVTGYAWNSASGTYIWFAPDDDFVALGFDPPHSARIEEVGGNMVMTGWARICNLADDTANCSGGLDGWIKLSGETAGGDPFAVELAGGYELRGFAYNHDALGWISFSSRNCDPDGDGFSNEPLPDCPLAGTPMARYGVSRSANVSGWAWSGYYGWISFNCLNAGAGGCGAFYGVNINPVNYNFSGYAWSSNFGWVSFNENDPPDAANLSNCSFQCLPASGCTACLNYTNYQIYGWAKILSLGDNGWVRLDDNNEADAIDFGVSIPGLPPDGDFHGYAYNEGNDGYGAGWISFNCNEGSETGGSICHESDYVVTVDTDTLNYRPEVSGLYSPNVSEGFKCEFGVRQALLRWVFNDLDGDPQDAYQIIVNTTYNSGDFETNNIFDTGKCDASDGSLCLIDPSANQYNLRSGLEADGQELHYGQDYYWWVRVWDDKNFASEWADSRVDGVGNTDVSFTIPAHEYPDSDFIWTPQNFSAEEQVAFISTTSARCYVAANPNSPIDCERPSRWYWQTAPTTSFIAPNSSYDASTTVITFSEANINYDISLAVTDIDGNTCTTSSSTRASKLRLPTWIEVK